MKYRIKYIRALTFAVFFCLVAVSGYIKGALATANAENRMKTEQAEAAQMICDASRDIRNAISRADRTAATTAADKTLEYIRKLNAASDVKRTLNKIFTDIKSGEYDDTELDTVLCLALSSGTREDICNICRRRTYTFSSDAEKTSAAAAPPFTARNKDICGSILCDSIKYRRSEEKGDFYYLYNQNQYACIDARFNSVVRFSCDCDIGAQKIGADKAEKLSKSAVSDCLPAAFQPIAFKKTKEALNGKVYTYVYSSSDNRSIYLSLRADTGSITFFDASEFYSEYRSD